MMHKVQFRVGTAKGLSEKQSRLQPILRLLAWHGRRLYERFPALAELSMSGPVIARMTSDEFIAWALKQLEGNGMS
jgi:hypothetical protein